MNCYRRTLSYILGPELFKLVAQLRNQCETSVMIDQLKSFLGIFEVCDFSFATFN